MGTTTAATTTIFPATAMTATITTTTTLQQHHYQHHVWMILPTAHPRATSRTGKTILAIFAICYFLFN